MKGWAYFAFVQMVSLIATVIGLFLLIPFCLTRAWVTAGSLEAGRQIDRWRFAPLNLIYGNPEDGVSGRYALIWTSTARVPYMPNAWAPWRAYCWSALRNSSDNLKYVFRWKGGPFRHWENSKHTFYVQAGWYPNGFPVLSAGRI